MVVLVLLFRCHMAVTVTVGDHVTVTRRRPAWNHASTAWARLPPPSVLQVKVRSLSLRFASTVTRWHSPSLQCLAGARSRASSSATALRLPGPEHGQAPWPQALAARQAGCSLPGPATAHRWHRSCCHLLGQVFVTSSLIQLACQVYAI